jgi:very-short-patch-repair endonuclease
MARLIHRRARPGVVIHRWASGLSYATGHCADRQAIRRDRAGRRRWLDAYWDQARLVAEVDGLWHMEAAAWWADMRRENDLTLSGLRVVLGFPAFAVRDDPAAVAAQLRRALADART